MEQTAAHTLYVSPVGNDAWSGTVPEAGGAGEGPLRTAAGARDRIRSLRSSGGITGPVSVQFRGGEYPVSEPVTFGPEDSGPVTYSSCPGEQAVISGGVPVTGWRETRVNGTAAWVTDVSGHIGEHGTFRSFFINGVRMPRPRLPKTGFFWMEDVPGINIDSWKLFDGSRRFKAKKGDIRCRHNIDDVDLVVMHFWIDERMSIRSYDPETGMVECSEKSIFALTDDWSGKWAKYYMENVFEALSEPGEWYLDRSAGKLYYIPRKGETPETVNTVIPRTYQWLRVTGGLLRFRNLTFRYTDWDRVPGLPLWCDPYRPRSQWRRKDSWKHFIENNGTDPETVYATVPQGAIHLPGSIFFEGARDCSVENCVIEHAGHYAVDIGEGCARLRLTGNVIRDFGAGGIKADGGDHTAPAERRTGNIIITDNHIHNGGRIAGASGGIILVHSFSNLVAHNEIHDLYYTGISCGWVWGYDESVSRNNRIEKNHIYDLGKGVLNDMGGIYLLGIQPGTVVRGNVIHDVEKANYGGSGIYLDEGSSHITVEENLAYNVSSSPFTQHYGNENIIRNNIFAFGSEEQVSLGRGPSHQGGTAKYAFSLVRNIILARDELIIGYGILDSSPPLRDLPWFSAGNLFWSLSGKQPVFRQGNRENPAARKDLQELQQTGQDISSRAADPKFRDPLNGDFTLPGDSPALGLGFIPFNLSDAGPRKNSGQD